MSFPSDVVLAAGTKLRVAPSLANRTTATYTITVGVAGATAGATSIPVSATTVFLQEGTKLTFTGNKVVTLTADALSGATTLQTTAVPSGGLSSGNTATTKAALQVLGGESLSFTISDNEVTTRSFEDGLYDDAKKIMIGASIPWSGHYVKGDKAIETVIQPAALDDREIYFEIEYPDGLTRSGFCYIQGYTEENSMDSVRKVSWTFRVVGAFTFQLAP